MSALITMQQQGWEAYAGKLGADLMQKAQNRLAWICKHVQGEHILEADCGQAATAILLARTGKTVVGLCNDHAIHRQARTFVGQEPAQVQRAIALHQGSLLDATSLSDRSFDTIIITECLARNETPGDLIEVAYRKLKPGGTLITLWPVGVQDDPLAQHTFFVREPARLLSRHFEEHQTHLVGDAIGFVSTARKRVLARFPANAAWPDELVQDLESALLQCEKNILTQLQLAKQQLRDAEIVHSDASGRLAALDQLQAQHESHAATLRAQFEALQDAKREAESAAERRIAELQAELQTRQAAVDQANNAVAQAQAQSRILELEQAQQIAVLRHEKLERDMRIQELHERVRDAEAASTQARSERDEIERQLSAASQSAQAEQSQLEQCIRTLEQALEAERHDAQTARGERESECAALQDRIQKLEAALSNNAQELATLREHMQQQKAQSENQIQALQSEKVGLEASLAKIKASHDGLDKQHQQSQLSLKTLNAQLVQSRNNSTQLETRAAEQARELQAQVAQAQSQYNSVANELKSAQLKYRELLQQFRDTQARDKENDGKLRHLERRVRNLTLEKEQALHQVEKTRRTQSFQLGYTLLHAFKSWSAFSRLPADLLRIRREAKDRRNTKNRKSVAQGNRQTELNAPAIRAPQEPVMLASQPAIAIGQQAAKTRIAAIMDEFTFHSYAPESELLQLRPETWRQEIEAFKPDLVFIESAWKGVEDLWARKVSNCSEEVRALLQWAKDHKIPSLFWNKEDPVHFSTFIELASLVDHVFTTDIDCIPKYKKILGHDRVYLLPFAAQPATHNPIEIYDRKDAFNFAGSYYLRYPERQRDFAALIDTVQQFKPVDIYDRNYDKPHPHYQFPEKYSKYILGTLKFDEIDRAYKGYRYGINMNTIKQSQTMFARRVFELLASNTVVVSNFSRGVRLMFGDLVISSDNADQIESRVRSICEDELTYRKFRLAGLRKVMAEHTYRHRLDYIKAKLAGTRYSTRVPTVAFVARATNPAELENLTKSIQQQSLKNCRLFVLTNLPPLKNNFDGASISCHPTTVKVIEAIRANSETIDLLGMMHPADYYGEHYAEDLALAATYCIDAQAFGKAAHYCHTGDRLTLANEGKQYQCTRKVPVRASVARYVSVTEHDLTAWLQDPNSATTEERATLAIDEFNYAANAGSAESVLLEIVKDLHTATDGVSFASDLAPVAEAMRPTASFGNDADDALPSLSGPELAKLFNTPASSLITITADKSKLRVQSKLPTDKHAYIYLQRAFRRDEINMVLNSQIQLICDDPGDVKTVFEFQDKDGKKLSHSMNGAAGTHALAIPNDCAYIRFGLRLLGRSDIKIHKLVFGTHGEKPSIVVGRSPILVLSKQYPAYDDLYKYGFLHTRVRSYKRLGYPVEIFRISPERSAPYREFENVDVVSGSADLLRASLETGRYKHVLIHILDANMWNVVKDFLSTIKFTVWAHGSEIQLWPRRGYEFADLSPEQITRKKKLSDNRKSFWRMVLSQNSENLSFVFVSNWLKQTTAEDLGVSLNGGRFMVIPNYVDSSIFSYAPKQPEHRSKILSIRPYTSSTYANDLTVQAILKLADEPFFQQLEFELCGDGNLFEETTKPLKNFGNVTLTQKFMTHAEIAQKHKNYGIFLCPTRMDTQGVSRDEAMSSGLVPVTNDVAAVGEFASEREAYLCPADDAVALANAIKKAFNDPNEFLRKSEAASLRVRASLNSEHTVERELRIFAIDMQCNSSKDTVREEGTRA